MLGEIAMKQRGLFLSIAAIIISITAILVITNPFERDVWDVNASKLKGSFDMISGYAYIEDLSDFTPFQWDELYSFTPYTSKEEVYKTIGYRWDDISEALNEGMDQIVFLKDGKEVCYIYGYPHHTKLSFNFGQYQGSFIRLTSETPLPFGVTVSDEGITYLDYIR